MERKAYTREFKEQAVKLSYTSAKPVAETAQGLGLPANMLHRWRREQRANGKVFPGKGNARDEEMAELKKRLRQTEQERDILKKAVGFFAQTPK